MTPERVEGPWAGRDIPALAKATFGVAAFVNLYAVMRVVSREDESIATVASGAFAPDSALLSPAQPALILWTAIYLGVFGHAVRVWLPDRAAHRRRHKVILPSICAAALNTLWIVCAQRGLVVVTGVVIAILLVTVWLAMDGVRAEPAHDTSSLVLIDGTYGLYLGWLLIATAANIDVTLTQLFGLGTDLAGTAVALVLLVAAGAGAVVAIRRFTPNVMIAVGFCWGLVWVVRARSRGALLMPTVAWAATVAAALVMTVMALQLEQRRSARRTVATARPAPTTAPERALATRQASAVSG